MADLRATALGLLQALNALGRAQEAAAWQQRLELAGWDRLTHDELTRIIAALAEASKSRVPSESHPPASENRPSSGAYSQLPDWAAPLSSFEPFVLAVDDTSPARSLELLRATSELLLASSFDQVVSSVRALFVDALGYEADDVDETSRLTSQHSLTRVLRIGRHRELVVLVVENGYSGPHANVYRPVLQLHPHAILVSFSPRLQRLRIVYGSSATRDRIKYRTLIGSRLARHPNDNLIVLARRFALLRPRPSDSTRDLEERAIDALSSNVDTIARQWQSVEIRSDVPPGLAWDGRYLGAKEFVQLSQATSQRLPYGLEFAFRHRFPIPVAGGRGRLSIVTWSALNPEVFDADRWDLLARKQSRSLKLSVQLRCDVETCRDGSGSTSCTTTAVWELPVPDERGEMILDGLAFGFCFDTDGARDEERDEVLESEDLEFDDELSKAAETEPSQEPEEPREGAVAREDDEDGEDDDEQLPAFEWTSRLAASNLELLFSWLVEKKLSAFASWLWRLQEAPETVVELERAMQPPRWGSGPLRLIAVSSLWPHLIPQVDFREPLGAMLCAEGSLPPAWACLEASSDLRQGQWFPICGARPHPAGGIAIPVRVDDVWRLKNVTGAPQLHQDRWRANSAQDSRAAWWLASRLQWFSDSAPGAIEHPSAVRNHLAIERSAARVSGETLRARVSYAAWTQLRSPPITIYRVVDIPNPHRNLQTKERPTLDVSPGLRVSGGCKWLTVPVALWPQGASLQRHNLEHALALVMDEPRPDEKRHELHLGPDEAGVVHSVDLHELPGPLGGMAGWRASIRIKRPHRVWALALVDGRMVELEPADTADMPCAPDGESLDLVVEDPLFNPAASGDDAFGGDAPATALRDPRTGDAIEGTECVRVLLLPQTPRYPSCPPDTRLRFRWSDGDGLPSDGSAPAITSAERRWLSAAHPRIADTCASSERSWSGGFAPYVPALQRILTGAGLEPLSIGPIQWQASLAQRPSVELTYEPTTRRPADAAIRDLDIATTGALLAWRCGCAALSGVKHATEKCRSCGTQVLHRPQDTLGVPRAVISLPFPVLHPWRLPAAAALLGLTTRELCRVIERYNGAHLLGLLRHTLRAPLSNAERRCRTGIAIDRVRELHRGIRLLSGMLRSTHEAGADDADGMIAALTISEVPALPELYRSVGAPPRAIASKPQAFKPTTRRRKASSQPAC